MKFIIILLNKIVFYFLILFFPLIIYSQTLELKIQDDGSRLILQQRESNVVRVIPSSGINYNTDFDMRKLSDVKFNKTNTLNWELKFSASGKVFKDVSFATPLVGYIVTELGVVYKTTDGGDNWASVMNLGFPYYWYGVDALTADTVVISGFNNQGNINSGVIRWSYNGGTTWTNDIILHIPSGVGWLSHIHFFDSNKGIVSAEFSGGMHYTTNGGKDTTALNYVQVNSDLGWFAGNIDTDSSGNILTTGIHFAHSSDYGVNWTSGPSADAVFDGGVDFLEDLLTGITGGGQISAPVSGWTHKTIDGGQNWSQRLYSFPYPIRAVKLFNDTLALAFGGNLYQEAGGIYITTDGGLTWNLDLNASAEMFSYDVVPTSPNSMDIWCVGSMGGGTGFIGKLYKTSIGSVVGIDDSKNSIPGNYQLQQNYPNPFNPSTRIKYTIPGRTEYYSIPQLVTLKVYDVLGSEVATLVNEEKPAGKYEVEFNGSNLTSGIYFYQLKVGNFIETKKMALLR
jgi:photosystem II stability/assembly factor-like uncharacterized protein